MLQRAQDLVTRSQDLILLFVIHSDRPVSKPSALAYPASTRAQAYTTLISGWTDANRYLYRSPLLPLPLQGPRRRLGRTAGETDDYQRGIGIVGLPQVDLGKCRRSGGMAVEDRGQTKALRGRVQD